MTPSKVYLESKRQCNLLTREELEGDYSEKPTQKICDDCWIDIQIIFNLYPEMEKSNYPNGKVICKKFYKATLKDRNTIRKMMGFPTYSKAHISVYGWN